MTGVPGREAVARLLETAAGLVALGWTTNANARRADGTPCEPEQPAAACWCAQGALFAATALMGQYGDARSRLLDEARRGLRKAIIENKHPRSLAAVSITLCITNWNDDEAESGEVVARKLRRAAAIVRDAA